MAADTLVSTRRAWHGAAELVLAGPQYRRAGTIRLRVVEGGFGTVTRPPLSVVGDRLLSGTTNVTLSGITLAEAAAAVGLEPSALGDVYHDGSGVSPHEVVEIDLDAAQRLSAAFEVGRDALLTFSPGCEPVLWPEHFDVAIVVGEVTYGVSPGDAEHPEPYAYIAPWEPRQGPFWNAPFGALLTLPDHPDQPDAAAIADFFRTGDRLTAR